MPYNIYMATLKELEITRFAAAKSPRSDRFPMRCSVRVCCLVTERAAMAQGLNISARGMAFVTCEALALGAVIQVALPNSGLSALARVRNCQWQDEGWRVGVELLGSLA